MLGTLLATSILVACAILFYVFERSHSRMVTSILSGFAWVARTLLQQEPPWEAATRPGGFLYFIVVVAGVGLVAIGTGAVASKLIEFVMRKDSGMGDTDESGHIVICGWNTKGNEILRELHAEEVEEKRPVVILAPLELNPTKDEMASFVRGNPSNADDLLRAGIDRADTAIILADRSNPTNSPDDIDAKTLLTTLAVESINRECYTCVEVLQSENRQHFQRAKADELVVSAELTGALLAGAAVTHGMSGLIADLVTHPGGNEFYSVEPPPAFVGRTFGELLGEMKDRYDCILMAIAVGEGSFDINPASGRVISDADRLLVISQKDPSPALSSLR